MMLLHCGLVVNISKESYFSSDYIYNGLSYRTFCKTFYKKIHKLGGTLYLNPDGHEWLRAKWPTPIRKYWKISEQMMVKYCDLAICDSVNIEKYIHECYDNKGIKREVRKPHLLHMVLI